MMVNEVLVEAFGRIQQSAHNATADLSVEQLQWRPDAEANSIGWLVWHLTRVQDDHIGAVFGSEQVWIGDQWWQRFGLDLPAQDTGFGHDLAAADKVCGVSADSLMGYHHATCQRTIELLHGIGADDLDRIIDESWDPPVTMGARLISVIADDLQHVGQAAYVRGIIERRH